MSIQLLNIQSIGYTANNNPNRARRGGEEFEEMIPAPAWREEIVKRNADVNQTVAEMIKVIRASAWQTQELSKRMLGKDLYTTCGNIWEFLFSHILYKEDDKGEEQLRTPALSWYLRRKRGIDCDDFSIFASTILLNLGIPHFLRIARYAGVDYFQHVYVVVPLKNKEYIAIDAVLDVYDAEKPTVETKDFLIMSNKNLNGIDVSVLSGIGDDDTLNEISGILEGIDFDVIDELEGLHGIEGLDELDGLEGDEGEVILGAIYNHMVRTRDVVRKNPHLISTVEDPQSFGDMLDYGLRYWNTDRREEALGVLEEKEDEINRLLGLDNLGDNGDETQLFYGIEGLGGVSVLGKVRTKKKFFKNIKTTVKKVNSKLTSSAKKATKNAGQKTKKFAKKVGKFIIKTNPVTTAARGGMLAAMKTNFLKIASKLKWGYLTEAEAKEHGFDIVEWRKSKDALTKAEKLFVNTLKGKAEAFKKAILTGRAGGLKGINDELGVVTAAAAGASLTAAMPFIKKLAELVKIINPSKLIAKVKANKLAKKQKKAETMPEVDEEAQSAQPDSDQSDTQDSPSNDSTEDSTTSVKRGASESEAENENSSSSGENSTSTDENTEAEPKPQEKESTNGTEKSNLPAAKTAATSEDVGIVTKVVNWVKENPKMSALAATGLVLVFVPSVRKAIGIGAVRSTGKKNKGSKKKNPPRAISGVAKKSPKQKYKNNSGKGKGRGRSGGARQVTL